MAFYLLFTEDGKYTGYSKNKKYAKGIIEQRKGIQKLYVEKMERKVITSKREHDLYMSEGEIFDYYGTYLFEHEQDHVHTTCLKYYDGLHQDILAYMYYIPLLKFTEDEIAIMTHFTKFLAHTGESIVDEFVSSEEPYYHSFDIKKLTMVVLKDLYKKKRRAK